MESSLNIGSQTIPNTTRGAVCRQSPSDADEVPGNEEEVSSRHYDRRDRLAIKASQPLCRKDTKSPWILGKDISEG